MRFPMPSIRPRRRWFQFSVRSLFLLTLLVALGLGWFMTEFRRAKRQTEAVAEIIGSGGTVDYDWAFGGYDSPSRFETQRRWLASVVDEGFLAYVVGVDYVPFPDNLDHGAYQTVDANLAPLERLPYVESLSLYKGLQITDAGLKHLEHLTRMRVLHLEGTAITDDGLQRLRAMSQLEELSISDCPRISGRGLEVLRQFAGLRKLSLAGAQITDVGLEQLEGLTQLKKLDVTYTGVTAAGVRRLRSALPRCKIDWTP